jgi:hypothetical protein
VTAPAENAPAVRAALQVLALEPDGWCDPVTGACHVSEPANTSDVANAEPVSSS